MNILVYGMTDNPGGVESVVMNYYRNITKENYNFIFLTHSKTIAYENEILQKGDKVIKIPPRKKCIFKYNKLIKSIFESEKIDVVWANTCSLSNITCLKFAKRFGVKTRIIHSHNSKNMGSKITQILHLINKRKIQKYATDFWACGELAGQYFYSEEIRQSTQYKIIPNAIDLNKFKCDKKIREEKRKELKLKNELVFGHIGRFHFQKNQKFLIQVFAEFERMYKNCKLVFVGAGEDENDLKALVKELNLEGKVLFLGLRADVQEILNAFDLVVFPSLFEGLSVALLEMQAVGLPIFASDTISEETKVNKNVEFLSLNISPEVWADKIFEKVNNLEREYDASKNLRERGFDIKTQVDQFVNLIEK